MWDRDWIKREKKAREHQGEDHAVQKQQVQNLRDSSGISDFNTEIMFFAWERKAGEMNLNDRCKVEEFLLKRVYDPLLRIYQ